MALPSLYRDYKKYLDMEKDPKKDHVDISHMKFIAPASLLPVISFAKKHHIEEYKTYDDETDAHLDKILGRSDSNSNLLPLLDIDLDKNSAKKNECLNRLNRDISDLLFSSDDSYSDYGGDETFPFVIGEIIRNVKQHSNAKRVYSYSQRYPKADCIDIGILDNGITIPGKYEQAKNLFFNENGLDLYEVEDDCEAIFRSLNGISTKKNFRRSRSVILSESVEEILKNGPISFGINSSIRLITEGLGGSFLIASRGGICHLTNGKAKLISVRHDPIDGTFVCIRFERKDLNLVEYHKIANNHDKIYDEDGKYKL